MCRCRTSHSIKTSFTHWAPHLQVYYLRVFGCVVTDRYHQATERERSHCVPHYRAPHSTLPLLPSLLSSPMSTHPWACLIHKLFFSLTMLPCVCAVTRKPLRQKDGSIQAQDALDITSGIHRCKDKLTQYAGNIQSKPGAAQKTYRLVWRLYSRGSLK